MDTSPMDVSSTSRNPSGSETGAQSARYEISSFDRFAATSATLTGVIGFFYSISFVIIARSAPALGGLLSALFLMLGGFFGSAALTGIYRRLIAGSIDKTLAVWAFLLGLGAALGSFVHGGYDLANALNPPASSASVLADLPNPIDPRGLLTFGLAGIGLLILSMLMVRSSNFSSGLSRLATILGILLVIVYLGRLIILSPASPFVLYPAALTGFIVNPLFYLWLGRTLGRS